MSSARLEAAVEAAQHVSVSKHTCFAWWRLRPRLRERGSGPSQITRQAAEPEPTTRCQGSDAYEEAAASAVAIPHSADTFSGSSVME